MEPIRYQIVDITAGDESQETTCDDEYPEKFYVIHLYGKGMDGQSVHTKITGFKPYFFIKVPDNFSLMKIKGYLNGKMKNPNTLLECKLVKRYDYYGFNNYKPETFIKFTCQSYSATFDVKNVLDKARLVLGNKPEYYEAKLAPFLRFLHERNIKPAGWVSTNEYTSNFTSKCPIDISVNCDNIFPYETNDIAPLKCSSFDIECYSGDHSRIPDPEFDEDTVTQIGTTTSFYGDKSGKITKHIITLKSCDPLDDTIVESYETEREVLIAWIKHINKVDPDIITGYNIYGFDFKYLYSRAVKLGIKREFSNTSRIKFFESELKSKTLSSSAMGFNEMYYMDSPGRLLIDLYKVVQRDYKFESYKLDNVAGEFIKGKIKGVKVGKRYTWLTVDNVQDIELDNFIGITIDKLSPFYCSEQSKFKVRKIEQGKLVIEGAITGLDTLFNSGKILEWSLKKDDIAVKDIFVFQNIDSAHRSVIAKYCIQDNILCNKLLDKIQVLSNNIAMANICYVPMSYLFLRGQGIKAYSLIAKQCMEDKYLIPDIENRMVSDEKYQGAIVLEANPGGYFNPVVVNDFASLYPSSIISHNLSPDTLITNKTGQCLYPIQKIKVSETQSYSFILPDTAYDSEEALRPRRGIIPRVLIGLLAARKATRKIMATETDTFQRFILEGRQLAYKLTANSIYGAMGSNFGAVAAKPVAESCTAVGRQLLQFARDTAKDVYPDCKIVYGDTDSLMVEYLQVPKGATKEEKEEILEKSMDCGRKVEEIVSEKLPWPHSFEYEKIYYPYILYSKKRYSGVMYSNNPKKYDKIDNKGIVLQRRDNAKIVKVTFQGALEAILFKQSAEEAFAFVEKSITDMCNGIFGNDYLTVTKTYKKTATGTHNDTVLSLRERIKRNPEHEELQAKLNAMGDKLKTELGHITMIRRMIERGDTSIQYNDRVPYIYIKLEKEQERMMLQESGRKTLLQGDRMETPAFIEEHNLKIDYAHYIESQIAKPLLQLLSIFEEDDEVSLKLTDLDKKLEYKEKQVMKRFFKPMIQRETLKQRGIRTIDSYFSKE